MTKKKILFVYRTPRLDVYNKWLKGRSPDSLLFGFNHLKTWGYDVDFFDGSYSFRNLFHPLFYPLEHAIIAKVGMGFKLDQISYLYNKINKYDVIVATGDSAGLPILALKHHGLISKPVIFMTAGLAGALKGKENSWVGKYYKKILKAPEVFTAYSKIEIDFFENKMGIPKNKIKYMPYCTDWQYFSNVKAVKKNIICAAGIDSGRDYKTLFEAVSDLAVQVEVACHPSNIEGLQIPKNVKIHLNIPISNVRQMFERSLMCIVPCLERNRSAGQMVVIEAASAGLPVIASKIKGLTGAFSFVDKKHLLFVKPEDPIDLREKIKFLLENPQKRREIGKRGSDYVKNNYTTKHLAKKLAGFIESL